MNNKESKSYKDMYHFTDKFYPMDKDKVPSLEADPTINTSIKKNPYRSNVEIEKDEIILQPDLSALFKAHGKKHSGGGIDVLLKPDSFVFSDDKSLAFTKEECDRFEFKKGGKVHKPKNYTPAQVLKKNIDIEHYNTLTNNLQDIKKDDLAKKSSIMMLDKYFQTLGNIAFLQEEKKDFPQGVPEFAANTAPVYDSELKGEIMEQKQYAKYGGKINPYMQLGGTQTNPFPTNWPPTKKGLDFSAWGADTPYMLQPVSGRIPRGANKDQYVYNEAQGVWYKKVYIDNEGNPAEGPAKTLSPVTVRNKPVVESGVPPVESGVPRRDEAIPVPIDYKNFPKLRGLPVSTQGNEQWFKEEIPGPKVPQITGQRQMGKEVNWQFTPYQKLQLGLDALDYASIKRYMPYRSRFNPSYTSPALLNPEQAIGDLKGAAYQQSQATNVLSPILRNAQQDSIYGNLLNQMPGVRSKYDEANAGITNQFRQQTAQVANQARMTNMVNDQNYYKESVVGQQNFDNAKAVASTAFKNDFFQSVGDNETLALNLLSQGPNPAYGYSFKTGNFTRNPQDILNTPTDTKSDFYTELANTLMGKIQKGQSLSRAETDFFKALSLGKLQFNPSYQKKGGKVPRRNPYSY